uniref:ZP domain-containing protein n=1 Tax=Meloidogyne hapla TaxID=6305 RepID=A0A1I8BA96_MELHA
MFFCSAIFFALQLIFCTSAWDVEDGEVFNNSLVTNTTGVMPELNNTYQKGMQMVDNGGMNGDDRVAETSIWINNISTTGKPANSTSDDVCLFVSCDVFSYGVGFIMAILAFAVFSVVICLYLKRKTPSVSVLPQNVTNN